MNKFLVIILFFIFFTSKTLSSPMVIRYFQTDQRYFYHIELLKLALEKSVPQNGDYSLLPYDDQMTQSRGLYFLRNNKKVDVAFLATNIQREQSFLPIKIPILRGILGYRVFMIHKENKDQFAHITTLKKLKSDFTAGFGTHWADIEILKHNGIVVDETVKYKLLFSKLNSKRFDYFPRGINEVWEEIAIFDSKYPNLMVDTKLAFYYPYPVYFFVNTNNTLLAERIERGLKIALNDGSFKQLFMSYHKEFIDRAKLEDRNTFRLENPTLPIGTSEPDTAWWLEAKKQ